MTNEELIDRQMCQMCNQRRECIKENRDRCVDYEDAVELLKEKDQQFKEYLEKNRTNYPDFMNGTDTYAFGMKEGYVKAFDKIINELFGGE